MLPPLDGECTVEKIAVNAVMAGAPVDSVPLLIAAVEAITDEQFNLHAINATTGSVVPALVVNGPIRDQLDIPYGTACLGGADGNAVSIGRALRLIIRNVGGHVAGTTSQSVYGNPGRVAGLVFGEWEERSPWGTLAAPRGIDGDAVTVFGAMGTMNIVDPGNDPALLLEQIGTSIAYTGSNGYANAITYSEVLVAINPIWAEMIAREYTTADDVQNAIWRFARRPMSVWPETYHRWFIEGGRVGDDGMVPLVPTPDQVLLTVAGGLGGLHAAALHGWGETRAATRAVTAASPPRRPSEIALTE